MALTAPVVARAATVRVTSDAELTAVISLAQPGDVVQLAPGAYGTIIVAGRGGPDADITITGEPGATIAGMAITGSTRLVVTGLAVAPAGAVTAYINVASSNAVTFSDLHLDGGAGGPGVAIWLTPDDLGVVIRNSTFLHCASPMCIRASSPDVLIEHNVFDELDDSDAVHGFGGGVIRYNHMDHALPAGNGNHNDFIQIGNGGPWTIDGNWFGVRTGGAASIWVDSIDKGVIHDVLIQNNVLTGHYVGQDVGIFVAGDDRQVPLLPSNVRVLNNTVTSGLLNSLRFGALYATIPVDQRPLVANNVGDRLRGMCDRIRSEDNVFADGEACSASDAIGDAALDANGAPTAASALLLGRADPLVAPPVDYFACPRGGVSDIGAIEHGACPPAPLAPEPPAVIGHTKTATVEGRARARARARILSVRTHRLGRRIRVLVRCSNATHLAVSLVVRGRVVARAARRGTTRHGVKLTLRAPRTGRLEVRVRALGAGGSAVRTITLEAPRA
ncbi:MAG TPA: hypothetical protein VFD90_15525 [Gaiellales bacterium]|nr:hypothetical protein [Gaiellales bacterium]